MMLKYLFPITTVASFRWPTKLHDHENQCVLHRNSGIPGLKTTTKATQKPVTIMNDDIAGRTIYSRERTRLPIQTDKHQGKTNAKTITKLQIWHPKAEGGIHSVVLKHNSNQDSNSHSSDVIITSTIGVSNKSNKNIWTNNTPIDIIMNPTPLPHNKRNADKVNESVILDTVPVSVWPGNKRCTINFRRQDFMNDSLEN